MRRRIKRKNTRRVKKINLIRSLKGPKGQNRGIGYNK